MNNLEKNRLGVYIKVNYPTENMSPSQCMRINQYTAMYYGRLFVILHVSQVPRTNAEKQHYVGDVNDILYTKPILFSVHYTLQTALCTI